MTCCGLIRGHLVDCLWAKDYATLSLKDQGCCCVILNNLFGGSCVIRC